MSESQKNFSVLYVEDEPDLIELCRVAFRVYGITMLSSETGEDAVEIVKNIVDGKTSAPDAFILDVLLPGISGMEIMKKIRNYPEMDNIPIIIFTNYSDSKIKDEVRATKNAEYILKTDIIPTQLAKIVLNKLINK